MIFASLGQPVWLRSFRGNVVPPIFGVGSREDGGSVWYLPDYTVSRAGLI